MNQKRICVVTGSRADYNYLKLIIEKIAKSTNLSLSLIVTGMHLLKEYGTTIELIKKDNIPITSIIPMYEEKKSSNTNLGKAIGDSIGNFTFAYKKIKPDIILLLGDRYEPLVAAIAALTLKIPVAHIHGGDISGTIDETIRHTLTKLSHIHFPATPKSAKRIKLMGEEEWRIHMVGSTSVDIVMNEVLLERKELCDKFELNSNEKIILCLQHPNVFESDNAGNQMKITLQVLKDLELQSIIIYPNNDLGSNLIINEIKSNTRVPKFKIFKNLERIDYLSLLKHIDVLVGNSSSGLIESPIFILPVVNIGTRNEGRESAGNVIHVGHNYDEIKKGIQTALSNNFKDSCKNLKNPYGDGTASSQIVNVLEDIEINKKLLNKKLTYNV